MVACSKRYPCIVTELIKRKASINIANKKGNRAITFVCQMGPLKTLEILIANGAETEFFNINGDTPLLIACRNGQCEVAKLLLQYYNKEYILFRAKIDGFDALFASVEQNRPDCVKLILDNGVPVDEKTDTNNEILAESTPLHLAAYYGRYESAKVLLDYGSDTNAKNINRMTPLHLAVMRNHEKIVELLIKYNANSNVYDMVGNTPASYTRNKNIIYILSNPLVEQIHKICCTPLQNLNIKINDLKEILLNKSFVLGINNAKTVLSNALDKKGRSPLTTAIIYSNIEVVEILAKIGVDPSLTDNKGLSAYVWS
jgi:ankyrin repeat protein